MPAKNSVKQFVENGCYHVYNRGVEKRNIFSDKQDYGVFLSYMKEYLNPTGSDPHPLASQLTLFSFCLMPNHFHLLIKQSSVDGITKLIRAVCTRYVMYFNKKYDRVGTLFQGKYKAILVDSDNYLLHLSRYIHLNPRSDPKQYEYSSYAHYLKENRSNWLNTSEILNYFNSSRNTNLKNYLSYESFIDDYKLETELLLGNLMLE